MEQYGDIHAAVSDFSGFQRRFTAVKTGFEEFFANFNPTTLNIPGVSSKFDNSAGTCTIEAFGRKFKAILTPYLDKKTLLGHVDFVEVVGEKHLSVERFLVTAQQNITTLAGETLMPAADFSSNQTLYILNLLCKGLSQQLTSKDI